jgi:antitoxin component of RelBE/YafQ-DinJ toxin-antitoxin module
MFKEIMEVEMAIALEKPIKNKPLTKPKPADSGFRRDNEVTLQTIRDVRAGVNVVRYDSIDDFFKDFHKK